MTEVRQPHLDALERDIHQLRVEFLRFFAGDRDRPPFAERDELTARVRQMTAAPKASTIDQFRLGSLTARLRSFNELFERRLRQHGARASTRGPATEGVLAGPERGTKAVRRLFRELYSDDSTSASIPQFQDFLERKVAEIRSRTGCSSVQFRVIEQDGKRTLRAKPLGRGAASTEAATE
jgi:hypothetical protein